MGTPIRLLVAVLVGAVTLVTIGGGHASACSCMDLPLADYMNLPLADYVDDIGVAFVGRQIERRVEDDVALDGTTLVFDLSEVYLGEATDPFEVRTSSHGTACGIDLAGQGAVAIAARVHRGEPLVGLCGSVVTRAELLAAFGDPTTPETASPEDDGDSEWPARLGLGALLLVVVGGSGVWIVLRRNAD